MPVLLVESNVDDAPVRRRLARAVAIFMHRNGVPLAHSVVKFSHLDAEDVFSGPYPFASFEDGNRTAFAFVTCRIAKSRDDEFRRGLVAAIAAALVPPVAAELLFVGFEAVNPTDYHRGSDVASEERRSTSVRER